jgi:hypothetical protein
VAGYRVAAAPLDQRRIGGSADIFRIRAAGMEAATRRRMQRAGNFAGQLDPLGAGAGVRSKESRTAARAYKDDAALAKISSRLAISTILPKYMIATRWLMCSTTRKSCAMNRYVSLQVVLQVLQQVDDLRLNRNVERRDRFVQHQEARLDRERPRDTDTLALAAGKFMRIAIERLRTHPDAGQQLHDPRFLLTPARQPMNLDPFADDRPHPHPRIQRRVRILKDQLHLPAKLPQFGTAERREVAAVIKDVARPSARSV